MKTNMQLRSDVLPELCRRLQQACRFHRKMLRLVIYLQTAVCLQRRHRPLWICRRTNASVLSATPSERTAACLLPSPPTQSCDCRDDSWHCSYKIRALGSESKGTSSLWLTPTLFYYSFLFLPVTLVHFSALCDSRPCFPGQYEVSCSSAVRLKHTDEHKNLPN